MVIDAHVHVSKDGNWFDTDLVATPERLLRQLDRADIDRAVLLPTFNNCDNETIFRICKRHPHRLIGFAVHAGELDGVTLCRVFKRVIPGKKPLGYLSYDHDPLFEYHR